MIYTQRIKGIAAAAVAALMLAPAAALAVPAKPGIIEREQADGSKVALRIVGDEFGHVLLSTDDYPLVEKEGFYWFAETAADGTLTASPYRFAAPERRDQATRAFLAKTDAAQARSAALARLSKKATTLRDTRAKAPSNMLTTHYPSTGSPRGLVLLVAYKDVAFNLDDPYDYFSRMLHEDGFADYGGTGCARQYFEECSNGQFSPQFDVYGPVVLPEKRSYYGANDENGSDMRPWEMAIHAFDILDPDVDFSVYDTDGDGLVDNVFIFYAGAGEASYGGANTVWPHSYDVRVSGYDKKYDGVLLGHYACSNEWINGAPDGVGTFCHEFSHVMGLPDLYTTDYNNSFTPGEWSILDVGPYNNNGRTPPLYSVFERFSMGWIEPKAITGAESIKLYPVNSNDGYIIQAPRDNEFFLLENRQQNSWDRYIPGHGMLVWHVDYDSSIWRRNDVNNTPSHQYVDIEEADNQRNEYTRSGDCFPGTGNITSFTDDTRPSMRTWKNEALALPITDIAESADGLITFNVKGGRDRSKTPELLEVNADSVSHNSFLAEWKEIPDAEFYTVYIDRKDAPGVYPNRPHAVETKVEGTSYRAVGLESYTDYEFYVTATQTGCSESDRSERKAVRTLPVSFEELTARVSSASDITENGFTANWQPVDGAEAYLLTVLERTEHSIITESLDFTAGIDSIPAGWSCSSKILYSTAGMYGEAAPALRMNANGSSIASPVFEHGISGVDFWYRGAEETEGNTLRLMALCSGQWIKVADFDVDNAEGGHRITGQPLPGDATAIRFMYIISGKAKGLALDDICIHYSTGFETASVEGWTDTNVGNTLSARVDGLKKDTFYIYSVKATDGTLFTPASAFMTARTGKDLGVEGIEADSDLSGDVYSTLGVRLGDDLSAMPAGIYIVNGHKVIKK